MIIAVTLQTSNDDLGVGGNSMKRRFLGVGNFFLLCGLKICGENLLQFGTNKIPD